MLPATARRAAEHGRGADRRRPCRSASAAARAWSTAYTEPSAEAMYTRPRPSAGEAYTCSSVVEAPAHRAGPRVERVAGAPSNDPMYTVPSRPIAGEEVTKLPGNVFHFSLPRGAHGVDVQVERAEVDAAVVADRGVRPHRVARRVDPAQPAARGRASTPRRRCCPRTGCRRSPSSRCPPTSSRAGPRPACAWRGSARPCARAG